MRLFKFILSHSLFISFCAAALTCQTFILLKFPINTSICNLIFFATLGSYNAYWVLCKWSFDKKEEKAFLYSNYLYNILFIFLSALGFLYYLLLIPELLIFVLVAFFFTFLYCLPFLLPTASFNFKYLGIVKTILLSLTWTFVTIVFPAHDLIYTNFHELLFLFSVRFLLLFMLCIIFDSRDIIVDKFNGFQSIATDFTNRSVKMLMFISFIMYSTLLFCSNYFSIRGGQFFVLLTTGVLAFLLYMLSFKKRSYYFYYFLVDGLMLFSALASYLVTI